jgi:hypothetical protein
VICTFYVHAYLQLKQHQPVGYNYTFEFTSGTNTRRDFRAFCKTSFWNAKQKQKCSQGRHLERPIYSQVRFENGRFFFPLELNWSWLWNANLIHLKFFVVLRNNFPRNQSCFKASFEGRCCIKTNLQKIFSKMFFKFKKL